MQRISWQDCIVPAEPRPYVWVAYGKEKPHLPIAVADTSRELAEALGVSENNVRSAACKYKKGIIKRTPYMCVYVGSV